MANPFLVIGGVIVGIITAGIGILQVPGWVASAQDSAAQNDVAQVTIGQAAMLSTTGKVAANIGEINSTDEAGVSVTVSNGVTVEVGTETGTTADTTTYAVVASSASGKAFLRVDGLTIQVFDDGDRAANLAAAKTAAGTNFASWQ